jgi:hypothetical protein
MFTEDTEQARLACLAALDMVAHVKLCDRGGRLHAIGNIAGNLGILYTEGVHYPVSVYSYPEPRPPAGSGSFSPPHAAVPTARAAGLRGFGGRILAFGNAAMRCLMLS